MIMRVIIMQVATVAAADLLVDLSMVMGGRTPTLVPQKFQAAAAMKQDHET
jgi:hypothetical protein